MSSALWLVALAATPEVAKAWLADSVIVDERVVTLPHGGHLIAFTKPRSHLLSDNALQTALFVVSPTGIGASQPLAEDCPSSLAALDVTLAGVWLRGDTSSCFLRFDDKKNLQPFSVKDRPSQYADLTFMIIPGTRRMLATRRSCDLVVFDPETKTIDAEASKRASSTVCESTYAQCVESQGGASFSVDTDGVLRASCADGASGHSGAVCAFDGTDVACTDNPELTPPVELDRTAKLEALNQLVTQTALAKSLWKSGKRTEAIAQWRELYRQWIVSGRPVTREPELEPTAAERKIHRAKAGSDTLRRETMIEVLNDLGFALWSTGQLQQAAGAYLECSAMLEATRIERPVLELNRGDLARDLGDIAAARAHYERFLSMPITAKQKAVAQKALAKLPARP